MLIFYSLYFILVKHYVYEDNSETEDSPNAKEKEKGMKLKFVHRKAILEMFLNLQFLQNN